MQACEAANGTLIPYGIMWYYYGFCALLSSGPSKFMSEQMWALRCATTSFMSIRLCCALRKVFVALRGLLSRTSCRNVTPRPKVTATKAI
eukprot:scaffold64505_cov35-Prasinocladus_malaysianus.AAC.1